MYCSSVNFTITLIVIEMLPHLVPVGMAMLCQSYTINEPISCMLIVGTIFGIYIRIVQCTEKVTIVSLTLAVFGKLMSSLVNFGG